MVKLTLPLWSALYVLPINPRTDAKAVSIIALGCFHPTVKVQSASVHFFLGSDGEKEDSDDEQEEVELFVVNS